MNTNSVHDLNENDCEEREEFKREKVRFRFKSLIIILCVFLAIAAVLYTERSGIQYSKTEFNLQYLSKEEAIPAKVSIESEEKTNLLITNTNYPNEETAYPQFKQILLDMKVNTDYIDLASSNIDEIPSFENYKTVIILLENYDDIKDRMQDLISWLKDGGSVLFAMAPTKTDTLDFIASDIGIESSENTYKISESIIPDENFMVGGGYTYEISDPFDSSLSVKLLNSAEVLAKTEKEQTPLIWKTRTGKGYVVVDNIGIYDKSLRGFYAASYSELQDVCIYPVINGSAFYLDDFPSPTPSGHAEYIQRDYQMSISDFYTNIWWSDMIKLAEKHDLRYTGVMIENYGDDTINDPVEQNDIEQFKYFGSTLLRQNGELGYHGYNHQPLCLTDTDYAGMYGYNRWSDESLMKAAVTELIRFQKQVLGGTECSVYVPPSNILSAAGRKMLGETFYESIKTIASIYFDKEGDNYVYTQEFGVADDGIVEQPRITSGGIINGYMYLAAVSELNMHYVSSHFVHPDDVLDEDRGAEEGWETYKGNLEKYLTWRDNSASSLRKQTGSELSAAIQRYASLSVNINESDNITELKIDNFYDEAWFFVRINDGNVGNVTGGTLEQVCGNLYLLKATSDTVTIERN